MENLQELLRLLNSTQWPHAVEPFDFHSEKEKCDRAKSIIEVGINVHLEKFKFLDLGCGDGHVTNFAATQKPHIAVGYDIKKAGKWASWSHIPNLLYTTDWHDVEASGPFDIILIWDVLDHVPPPIAPEILKKAKSVLAPNGKIHLRTHPWTSRHGSHLYLQLNKAYAHLIFNETQLKALGLHQEEILKFLNPPEEYNILIDAAGLKIQQGPYITEQPVEDFFKEQEIIKDALNNVFNVKHFPEEILEMQFVDYVLY